MTPLAHMQDSTTHTRRSFNMGLLSTALAGHRGLLAQASGAHFSVAEFDRVRILAAADKALRDPVVTLGELHRTADGIRLQTAVFWDDQSASSAGDLADVDLLTRMVRRTAALTAAWRLTGQATYLQAALAQVAAWCVTPATRMLPTLEGSEKPSAGDDDLRFNPLRFTLCLAEFARTASFLCNAADAPEATTSAIREWTAKLLAWFTDSDRGTIARESTRQDAIFWTMQAAELARFTRNDTVLRDCNHRFRDKLLRQLSLDGYLPYTLQSKRPYAEAMLLLECMGSACESLTTPFDNVWNFTLADGRGMRAAVAWAAPFLQNRGKWPYVADVRGFSRQPLRENTLLFAARAWNRIDYADLWKSMKPDTDDADLQREHPITQPALWAQRPPA